MQMKGKKGLIAKHILKQDSIAKLKSLYMVLGGNVNLITKESLIEIYLKPSDEERKNFVKNIN